MSLFNKILDILYDSSIKRWTDNWQEIPKELRDSHSRWIRFIAATRFTFAGEDRREKVTRYITREPEVPLTRLDLSYLVLLFIVAAFLAIAHYFYQHIKQREETHAASLKDVTHLLAAQFDKRLVRIDQVGGKTIFSPHSDASQLDYIGFDILVRDVLASTIPADNDSRHDALRQTMKSWFCRSPRKPRDREIKARNGGIDQCSAKCKDQEARFSTYIKGSDLIFSTALSLGGSISGCRKAENCPQVEAFPLILENAKAAQFKRSEDNDAKIEALSDYLKHLNPKTQIADERLHALASWMEHLGYYCKEVETINRCQNLARIAFAQIPIALPDWGDVSSHDSIVTQLNFVWGAGKTSEDRIKWTINNLASGECGTLCLLWLKEWIFDLDTVVNHAVEVTDQCEVIRESHESGLSK